VQGFEGLPDYLHVQPVAYDGDVIIQRPEVEADEMRSFVKKNQVSSGFGSAWMPRTAN
jgi:hypothetical protein